SGEGGKLVNSANEPRMTNMQARQHRVARETLCGHPGRTGATTSRPEKAGESMTKHAFGGWFRAVTWTSSETPCAAREPHGTVDLDNRHGGVGQPIGRPWPTVAGDAGPAFRHQYTTRRNPTHTARPFPRRPSRTAEGHATIPALRSAANNAATANGLLPKSSSLTAPPRRQSSAIVPHVGGTLLIVRP